MAGTPEVVQATAWGAAAREGCSLLLIWPQEDPGASRADSGKDGEGSRGHAELAGPLRPRWSVHRAKEEKDGTHGRDTLAPARQTFPFPRAMVAGLFKTLWPFVPHREERDVAGWLSCVAAPAPWLASFLTFPELLQRFLCSGRHAYCTDLL